MRINSQEQIKFATNRSSRNANQIEKSIQKLASGLTIAKGSQNASGIAISEKMRAQVRGLSQAQKNMQDGLSVLESTNEGLKNVNDLLQRARELSVMTANGTLTDVDRTASQEELTQLMNAIDDTANMLEFNTKRILGKDAQLLLQVGANPTQQLTISLSSVSTTSLGLENASVLTREDASQLISKLDASIEQVTSYLTRVGSDMTTIEHHLNNATLYESNLTQSLSIFTDTDVAKEMMTFINLDIRQKGDQLLVNQVNRTLQASLDLFSK